MTVMEATDCDWQHDSDGGDWLQYSLCYVCSLDINKIDMSCDLFIIVLLMLLMWCLVYFPPQAAICAVENVELSIFICRHPLIHHVLLFLPISKEWKP